MKNLLIMATEYKSIIAKENVLKAEKDALRAEMIKAMHGQEKVVCGQYTIRNQVITSNVLNTARLKAEKPDVAEEYTEEKTTTRFTVG